MSTGNWSKIVDRRSFLKWAGVLGALPIVAACQPQAAEKVVTKVVEKEVTRIIEKVVTPLQTKKPPLVYVLSNSSPHISVIDTGANQVVKTANIPAFAAWGWNDANNYFDGTSIWLGLQNKGAQEAEYIAINANTLEVVSRLSLGKEELTTYSGKALPNGHLLVGKMHAEQVVVIDTKNFKVLDTWKVPVLIEGHSDGKDSSIGKGVICDFDTVKGPDGVYRSYYMTRDTDAVASIDAETGKLIKIVASPKGSTPFMGGNAPDGTFWVTERWGSNNTGDGAHTAVYHPVTLDLIKRFPSGKVPIDVQFSPDGKLAYIPHSNDDFVQVVDTKTYDEVTRVKAGNLAAQVAVDPNGKSLYVMLSKEAAIAVVDTSSWQVTQRINIGNNPNSIFLIAG